MTLDEFRTRQAETKRCAILEGAQRVFLRDGYERATIQKIADEAGVSTRTIYKHFDNKEALFIRLIREAARAPADVCDPGSLCCDEPPARALQRFGMDYARLVTSDAWRDLLRVIIAEAGRTPGLGGALFEHGTCPYADAVRGYLVRRRGRGLVEIPDEKLAATQFLSMINGVLFWPRLLLNSPVPGDDDLAAVVESAVGVFMARYGA